MTNTTTPATVTITSPAPGYYRNQADTKGTHRVTNALSDNSVVGTACGRTFCAARAHLSFDTGDALTCTTCRNA